ncbi:putative porin [Steroidobacter sp.]|uniref:putative porin n=1 Tax=Steroidobacter sp. TaxID=1978227 RepID=UPI001A5DB5D6|nr:putative porin [Steroidobacter sp.]MBL8271801.1 putative porin [Steroidobacter sp.]
MKNLVLAAAVATALSSVPMGAFAASPNNDLAQIREQLEGLLQRVDKLEQENTQLKQENDNLKAADEKLQANDDYLKAEAKGLRKEAAQQAAEVSKVKGADWAGKLAITGDVRYRYEMISDETLSGGVQTADRYRDRVRARVNAVAKATDNITVGVGFATTENGDPRSSNQTLTGSFSRKSLDLDLAYFDWKFASWGNLIGGKMKQPFVKPGQSLFWDNDINPEGLAVGFNSGIFFGTAYNYWLTEQSGLETTRTADTMLHGLQIGTRLPIGSSTLMLAAHYYDLSAGQGRAPFYNSSANGNTTVNVGTPATAVLLNDYEVINLSAEFNTQIGALPLQIWADVAQNQDPSDLDTAWSAGVLLGKASNYRTWEVGALYQVIEKDALFAQLIDSDFGAGVSDTEGWVLRAGYTPIKNWTLNATYFLNKRNVDRPASSGQTEIDYDRLQLDFNVKF